MLSETIDNLQFFFEINGKFACIKKIGKVYGFDYEANPIKKIVIPQEVHYNNYTYIVNEISGYTTQEEQYKEITDRRRKDYGKQICTATVKCWHDMIDLPSDGPQSKDVILPETIREIGPCVVRYRHCFEFKLNNGLKTIRCGAFWSYHSREIEIPSSVKTIEEAAFINSERLKLFVDNEPGLIKIDNNAIVNTSLTGVVTPRFDFEIIYLRPKTSWFSRLIKKIKSK